MRLTFGPVRRNRVSQRVGDVGVDETMLVPGHLRDVLPDACPRVRTDADLDARHGPGDLQDVQPRAARAPEFLVDPGQNPVLEAPDDAWQRKDRSGPEELTDLGLQFLERR